MAVKIAHSSIDERGKASGGVAGDQTQKEVCIRDWYNKGWGFVIRFKDRTMAERFAKEMENAAKNNNIGYNQNNRNTILIYAEEANWDLSKITTPCDSDCSSLITVCAIAAGVPKDALYKGGNCCTTRNLKSRLNATGLVEIFTDTDHTGTDKYSLKGDIYLKEGSHVIATIEDGEAEKINSNSVKPTTSAPQVGYKEGDVIQLKPGAKYYNGRSIPAWVFKKTLYYRGENNNGIIFSTLKTGAVTGVVKPEMLVSANVQPNDFEEQFKVQILASALYVRKGPSASYVAVATVKKPDTYTIVEENNGWGRLANGKGWISLSEKYVKRL